MSRLNRVVIPGFPHHITHRGNRGEDVFSSPDDYQQYLIWLAEHAEKCGVKVWAYCLMTNHVHIIAVPASSESLAGVFRTLQMRHARQINTRTDCTGHLWAGRYFSCPLDDAHLWEAVRYVERNAVRAGLAKTAEEYDWSSAPPHCGLRPDPVLSPDLPLLQSIDDWSEWLQDSGDEATLSELRRRTRKGIPCGDDAFLRRVGKLIGRTLLDRPRGRPRKKRPSSQPS